MNRFQARHTMVIVRWVTENGEEKSQSPIPLWMAMDWVADNRVYWKRPGCLVASSVAGRFPIDSNDFYPPVKDVWVEPFTYAAKVWREAIGRDKFLNGEEFPAELEL